MEKKPRIWLGSLRVRLTLWFSGVLALILIGASFAVFAGAQHILLAETDSFLETEARHLVLSDPAAMQTALETLGQHRGAAASGSTVFNVVYARLVLPAENRTVAASPDLARRPALASLLDTERLPPPGHHGRWAFVGPDMDGALRVLTLPVLYHGKDASLQVAVPWVHNDDILDRLILLLVLGVPTVLALMTVGGWTLIQRTLQPISRIVTEAERLDVAALPEALLPEAVETDSEIGQLVGTLNRMTTRLHAAFEAQRRFAEAQQRFAADASHELRTPLTILRGEMELALSRERTPDEYRAVLAGAVDEIGHLSRIVEGLGFLARQDAGHLEDAGYVEAAFPLEVLDLSQITAAVVAEFRRPAAAKNISLTAAACTDGVPVAGSADHLLQLVRNLLDNAVKYTLPGGAVTVTCDAEGADAHLTVCDTGLGIAPEDLPHVFERFWRADRSRSSAGSGLGLAICADIARTCGGQLSADSVPGHGSRFHLRLPLASSPPR